MQTYKELKTISILKSFIKAYYLFKRTVSGFKYRTNFKTAVRVYSQSCLMFFSKEFAIVYSLVLTLIQKSLN